LPEKVGWKDVAVPKLYPQEFREDVVQVARKREAGVTLDQRRFLTTVATLSSFGSWGLPRLHSSTELQKQGSSTISGSDAV
jgi:hypothetical protein